MARNSKTRNTTRTEPKTDTRRAADTAGGADELEPSAVPPPAALEAGDEAVDGSEPGTGDSPSPKPAAVIAPAADVIGEAARDVKTLRDQLAELESQLRRLPDHETRRQALNRGIEAAIEARRVGLAKLDAALADARAALGAHMAAYDEVEGRRHHLARAIERMRAELARREGEVADMKRAVAAVRA